MPDADTPDVMSILKNILLAAEANGLSGLPFVRDARRFVDRERSLGLEACLTAPPTLQTRLND